MRLEPFEAGWRVDSLPRQDIDGAEKPDLSVIPVSNTFSIRRISVFTSTD